MRRIPVAPDRINTVPNRPFLKTITSLAATGLEKDFELTTSRNWRQRQGSIFLYFFFLCLQGF